MANDFKRMWTKAEIKGIGGGVTEEQFEELVRATPTDVNLVQDQGVWQLQLEHDTQVLSITNIDPFTDWVEDTIDEKISGALTEEY